MSEQQTQATTGERVYERCLCREAADRMREVLGISPAVKQHLVNSRIEFLKAIRAVLDGRISSLSRTAPQEGTKVVVE